MRSTCFCLLKNTEFVFRSEFPANRLLCYLRIRKTTALDCAASGNSSLPTGSFRFHWHVIFFQVYCTTIVHKFSPSHPTLNYMGESVQLLLTQRGISSPNTTLTFSKLISLCLKTDGL